MQIETLMNLSKTDIDNVIIERDSQCKIKGSNEKGLTGRDKMRRFLATFEKMSFDT